MQATDTHHAAVLDDRGRLLGTESFGASAAGYRELLAWLASFGVLDRVGVESIGSYAAGLTRYLRQRGCPRARGEPAGRAYAQAS